MKNAWIVALAIVALAGGCKKNSGDVEDVDVVQGHLGGRTVCTYVYNSSIGTDAARYRCIRDGAMFECIVTDDLRNVQCAAVGDFDAEMGK